MSLIDTYRSTLKSLICGDVKRIIITTQYGTSLIKQVFSQKELLDMEISGIFLLGDLDVLNKFATSVYEIVFFVEGDDDIELIKQYFPLCTSNIFIHFYSPIVKSTADDILVFDTGNLVRDITSTSLGFIPISNFVAVNDRTNIFSVMRRVPNRVIAGRSVDEVLLKDTNKKIQECIKDCTLFETTGTNDPSLLIVCDRSFDKITPLLIPWRYESMLHFHNVKIKNHSGHCNDRFFSDNRYEFYENVSKKAVAETNALKVKYTTNKIANAKDTLEYEEANKMISKHVDAMGELREIINCDNQNVIKKSEMTQRALIRDLSNSERAIFRQENSVLESEIYSTNKISFNKDVSIHYQYSPKIKDMIRENMKNGNYKCIYIYVKDYICYEEVAEVELFNKNNIGVRVYLLSDTILNQWNYIGLVNKNICTDKFRVNRPLALGSLGGISDIQTKIREARYMKGELDSIQEKIEVLEKFPRVIFDDKKEKEYNSLAIDITNLLTREYDKLKKIEPANKLEENNKNIKLLKLSKLTARFKELEYRKQKQTSEVGNNTMLKYFDVETQNQTSESFSLQQFQQVQNYDDVMTERLIDERGEQIIKIAQGVHQINSLYLDMKRLIELQSLKLEEIEVHMISSADLTKQGAEQLVLADESHASATSIQQKITMGLGMVATLLIGGVALKFGLHH